MNQDNNKNGEDEKNRYALAPLSRLRAPATFARSPPIINPSLPTLLALSLSLPTSLPPSLPLLSSRSLDLSPLLPLSLPLRRTSEED